MSHARGTPGSCTATTGTGYPGNTMLVPASGLVVYEVLFSNPSAIEAATVSVSVNPTGGTPQTNVTAGAVVGFAPFYASGGAADPAQLMTPQLIAADPSAVPPVPASAPVPRFRDDLSAQVPLDLFSYTPCATLTGSITSKSGPANGRVWTVSVAVTNSVVATGVQITGFTLTQTSGPACTPAIQTPLPVVIGDLPTFTGSGNVTVNFSGCAAIARFTVGLSFSGSNAISSSKTLFNQFR